MPRKKLYPKLTDKKKAMKEHPNSCPFEVSLKDVEAVTYHYGMKVDAPIVAKRSVKVYDRMVLELNQKAKVSTTKEFAAFS